MPPLLVWLASAVLAATSVRCQEALVTVTALGRSLTSIDQLRARYLPMGPVMEVEGTLLEVRGSQQDTGGQTACGRAVICKCLHVGGELKQSPLDSSLIAGYRRLSMQ